MIWQKSLIQPRWKLSSSVVMATRWFVRGCSLHLGIVSVKPITETKFMQKYPESQLFVLQKSETETVAWWDCLDHNLTIYSSCSVFPVNPHPVLVAFDRQCSRSGWQPFFQGHCHWAWQKWPAVKWFRMCCFCLFLLRGKENDIAGTLKRGL